MQNSCMIFVVIGAVALLDVGTTRSPSKNFYYIY